MKSYFHEEALKRKLDLFSDFRLKEKRLIKQWVQKTIFSFFTVLGLLIFTHVILYKFSNNLENKKIFISKKMSVIQLKIKSIVDAKEEHEVLLARQRDFEQSEHSKAKLINLLRFLSGVIPKNTWLEKVALDQTNITIDGCTNQVRETGSFYKKLGKLPIIENCRLQHASKGKRSEFSITANLS